MTAEEDPVPISLVVHQVFCPRRAWLESVGERTDTYQVAAGLRAHQSVDDSAVSRPAQVRALEVASRDFGVVGRCDRVEVAEDGSVVVVEHKATPVRRRPDVTRGMRVQLVLQVAALREMGYVVRGQAVYFTNHRTRVAVELADEDFMLAREAVESTRSTVNNAEAPPALEDDPRCRRCSHVDVCLPDERTLAPVTRRIIVSDPETQVLHLLTPGSRGSLRRGRIEVMKGEERLNSFPIERVQGVVVHGNVDLSGALIRELLWRSLPVVWATSTGRVVGWAGSARGPNGAFRPRQHEASHNGRLDLAQQFVGSKIANQATLLRRLGDVPRVVVRLRTLARSALETTSLNQLLGVEGDASARYFAEFASMLDSRVGEQQQLLFTTRTRRPALDPVNAALNFAYGLLLGDVMTAVASCGMDPHAGFLHSSERNKPALALDLAEEFRAPVADSVVLTAFNNGELKRHDFTSSTGSCALTQSGRRALITTYERRVQMLFTHPIFRYKVTWRRAMEIQARLVLGVIDGTQQRYIGIRIR